MASKATNKDPKQKRDPRNGTSNLVLLISELIRNTGLLAHGTVQKVHWAANAATICFLIACILQIIALFMAKDDPERLFECFSVLAFCGMGVFKLNSLRSYYSHWQFLLNQISNLEEEELNSPYTSDLDYASDDEKANNFSNYVINYTDKFKTTSGILRKMYSFTAVIFILSPFLEYAFYTVRGNDCLTYPHILPGWTPLDDFSIFGYLVTVSCELIAAVYCVCVHIAFDLTAIGVMIFVCGQFALLCDYSARIAGNGKASKLSKKRDDRARFRFRHCHHISLLLITSINKLDKLLKDIIGVYFFVATLTLCSVAVRLNSSYWKIDCKDCCNCTLSLDRIRKHTHVAFVAMTYNHSVEMSVMQLVSLLQYMCATLTQLFLFCRYGDAVLHESSVNMGQGPFAAAYWCLSPKVRRDLVLLSIGMMIPRHLNAGPFNYLDLPSFIQVVRTAYSYYAVLGQK